MIMVSPKTDILKITSTIIQRKFECFEAFLLISHCSYLLSLRLWPSLTSSDSTQLHSQQTIVQDQNFYNAYASFSTLRYIIRPCSYVLLLLCFKLLEGRANTFFIFHNTPHMKKILAFFQCHAQNIPVFSQPISLTASSGSTDSLLSPLLTTWIT